MKRTITSLLGALTVAASLLAVPAAHANHNGTPTTPIAVLGCVLVNDQAVFPRNAHYYYCGLNAALYRNSAASTFTTMPTHLRTLLYNANTYLFVWDGVPPSSYPTPVQEMNQYFGTSESVVDTGGFSLQFGFGLPFYGVNVFERVQPLFKPMQQLSSSVMNLILIHEQGHALDNAYGTPSTNPNSVFRQTLTTDWDAVNALPESTVFPHGIPLKRATATNGGTWVTYNPPAGPSTPQNKRNQIIIEALFPALADPSEMYASLYAQSRSKVTDVMNPYTDSVALNGRTLSLIEVLRNFPMTKLSQTPKRYFDKMWSNDPTFTP